MSPSRLAASLCLLVLACASEGSDAELVSRLDQIDARLAALETQVQTVADWTTAQADKETREEAEHQARLAELETRRAAREAEREAKRAERELRRRSLFDSLGDPSSPSEDDLLGGEELGSSSSREIEGAAEGIQCTEPAIDRIECSIDRAFLDHLMANPALLTRQARVVPSQRDGVVQGFKLYGIRRGSLPKLLGLENGDMLVSINGDEIDGIDAAMELYTKLRKAKRFLVEVERRGKPLALTIEIIS
ncbi:MAG: hypothetical protein H6712_01240 [Myxococcales bacterium]|nr:hypothetical protein [Myxococcales bacterium]MCB9712449.1 hypothetical protein [Myxococcales bacterium]